MTRVRIRDIAAVLVYPQDWGPRIRAWWEAWVMPPECTRGHFFRGRDVIDNVARGWLYARCLTCERIVSIQPVEGYDPADWLDDAEDYPRSNDCLGGDQCPEKGPRRRGR